MGKITKFKNMGKMGKILSKDIEPVLVVCDDNDEKRRVGLSSLKFGLDDMMTQVLFDTTDAREIIDAIESAPPRSYIVLPKLDIFSPKSLEELIDMARHRYVKLIGIADTDYDNQVFDTSLFMTNVALNRDTSQTVRLSDKEYAIVDRNPSKEGMYDENKVFDFLVTDFSAFVALVAIVLYFTFSMTNYISAEVISLLDNDKMSIFYQLFVLGFSLYLLYDLVTASMFEKDRTDVSMISKTVSRLKNFLMPWAALSGSALLVATVSSESQLLNDSGIEILLFVFIAYLFLPSLSYPSNPSQGGGSSARPAVSCRQTKR